MSDSESSSVALSYSLQQPTRSRALAKGYVWHTLTFLLALGGVVTLTLLPTSEFEKLLLMGVVLGLVLLLYLRGMYDQPKGMATPEIQSENQQGLEAARAVHRQNLERLVEQRTLELVRSRDEAQAATKAKSAFLASMSHEIRTPMNAIIGLAHLLRKQVHEPGAVEKLEQIQSSGKHLLSLINDILDFSKIEADKLLLAEDVLDIRALAANVKSMLSESAAAKGLRLCAVSDPLPVALRGDAIRITQALVNLAGNAVKFTERGSVTLRIRQEAQTLNRIKLRFEVEDTGMGIEPEELATLFMPFQQADGTQSKQFGGTGLGLAITRKLAELMGGETGATSHLGAGSLFWFTAWLDKLSIDDLAVWTKIAKGQSGEPGESVALDALADAFAGTQVLLVEDDEINQMVTKENLLEAKLAVDVVANGFEAVERMRQAKPGDYGLILMDMQMPVMDGLEATRQIRQLPIAAGLPIIALTANAFREDTERCLAAGMDDFIAKPVDPDRMFATILASLQKANLSGASGSVIS